MNKMMKYIYICVGFIAFGLGAIGVVLPILPTTPFLLLASFCFIKGSSKIEAWYKQTSIYKKYLKSFEENKSMTMKTKLCIVIPVTCMLAIPFFKVNNIYMRVTLLALVACKYYYFFNVIKTVKKEKPEKAELAQAVK